MKKLFYVAALSALVLASCAKNEMTETPSDDAISFSTYSSQATRGTIMDDVTIKDNLNGGFGVFAYYTQESAWDAVKTTAVPNYMYNQRIVPVWNATPEFTGWHYNPIKYWPNTTGHKISFFAYAPYYSTSMTTAGVQLPKLDGAVTGAGYPLLPFVVAATPDAMVDLLYANGADTKDQLKKTTPVKFTFNHALSRVYFEAKINKDLYGDAGATQIKNGVTQVVIRSVKIDKTSQQFWAKGTMSLKDASWNAESLKDHSTDANDYDLNNILLLNSASSLEAGIQQSEYDEYLGEELVTPLPINGNAVPLFRKSNVGAIQEYLFLIPADYKTQAGDVLATDNGISNENGLKVKIAYDIVTRDPALTNGYSIASTEEIVSLPVGTLKHGVAYKFTFTIGLENIQVEEVVTDWGTEEAVAAPSITLGSMTTAELITALKALKTADKDCNFFTVYVDSAIAYGQDFSDALYTNMTEFADGDIISFEMKGNGAINGEVNVSAKWQISTDKGLTWETNVTKNANAFAGVTEVWIKKGAKTN